MGGAVFYEKIAPYFGLYTNKSKDHKQTGFKRYNIERNSTWQKRL